jgi:hypothetical protein
MKIEMWFYGMTKDLFPETMLTLYFSEPVLVNEIKTILLSHIKKDYDTDSAKALLSISAIATNLQILNPESMILQDQQLSLLPPVSGG